MTAAAIGLALSGGATAPASAATTVHLTFQETLKAGTGVTVREVTRDRGTITDTTGPSGTAARFPAYVESDSHRAALAVSATQGRLNPGRADLVVRADFRLDKVTQGSAYDDGNNILQRGLFGDPAQFKIQVDGRTPACRFKGSAGSVLVTSPVKVSARTWYRVRCARSGKEMTLRLVALGSGKVWTRSATRAIGTMSFASGVPLAVGAKLNGQGTIPASSDQFNGRLDNILVKVG